MKFLILIAPLNSYHTTTKIDCIGHSTSITDAPLLTFRNKKVPDIIKKNDFKWVKRDSKEEAA